MEAIDEDLCVDVSLTNSSWPTLPVRLLAPIETASVTDQQQIVGNYPPDVSNAKSLYASMPLANNNRGGQVATTLLDQEIRSPFLSSRQIAKALIDNNHDEHSFRVRPIALVDVAVKTQRRPGEKQAMKMTEYGKHGKPRSRLPTLPKFFGNPFGIPTFPRPRRLDS